MLRKNNIRKKYLKSLVIYAGFGYSVALSICIGLVVGLILDKLIGSGPFMMLVFLLMGVFAAFRNMIKMLRNFENF